MNVKATLPALLLSASVLALSAHAQTETPGAAVGLEEIVVTAQKRAQNLQSVPAAVTGFSSEALEKFGFADPMDLTRQTPGLQIKSSNGATKPNVFLRGIGTNDFNATAATAVGFYLDEVYQGLQSGQLFQMFDLERVEVLRGPQGTLYGRNTTGGAVNFFTRKPGDSFGGNLAVTYGRFDQVDVEGGVDLPLLDDRLAARVAGIYRSNDGNGFNEFTKERVGGADTWALRAVTRFEPTDAQSWLLNINGGRLVGDGVRYHFQRVNNGAYPDNVLPIIGVTPPFQPPATYWNGQWDLPQKETTDSFGTSLKGDINLGSVTFTSITGYQEVDAYVRFDSDASPLNYVNVVFSDDNWQFSQELRLASDTAERFQWIAGAYYYRDSVRAANNFDIARFARVLFGAPPNLADPTAPISIDQTYLQKTESYAVFASTTYRLTDQFKATAGLRWTRDSKSLDYQTGADAARAIGIPFLIDVDRERSWNAVTGNATLDYQVNDDILTYASYNRGFKSGVFNAAPFFSAADVNSANPEKVDAYEIGLKNTLLDNRLRLNLAAFYNNFSNLQVFQFIPDATTGIPTSRYSNAGSARVKGVEFEVQVQATEGLFFQLAGAALDAKYKTFIAVADNPTTPANETQDLSGNRLNAAPKFNISGVVEYVLPISNDWLVTPRYEFTYNSRQFFTSENTAALSQKAYGIHNASLALANTAHDVELTLFIKNLTGTRYNNEILPLPDFGFNGEIRGARQSYGATLSYKF